jgi:hypothetical protein
MFSGHSFDRQAIEKWLQHNNKCPMCHTKVENVIPVYSVKSDIEDYLQKMRGKDKLLHGTHLLNNTYKMYQAPCKPPPTFQGDTVLLYALQPLHHEQCSNVKLIAITPEGKKEIPLKIRTPKRDFDLLLHR